jgi:hypothetical protein
VRRENETLEREKSELEAAAALKEAQYREELRETERELEEMAVSHEDHENERVQMREDVGGIKRRNKEEQDVAVATDGY